MCGGKGSDSANSLIVSECLRLSEGSNKLSDCLNGGGGSGGLGLVLLSVAKKQTCKLAFCASASVCVCVCGAPVGVWLFENAADQEA